MTNAFLMRSENRAPGGAGSASGGVRTIARAAKVLRALSDAPDGLTLSELSGSVELPVSTVHRLISALDDEGLVRAQPRGRIFLGPLMMDTSRGFETALDEEVNHVMRDLSAALQETVDVAVLDGAWLRFVAQCSASGTLRAVSSVGVVFPLHCTGSGKAFLARMSRREAASLLPKRLSRLTSRTITSRRTLWGELDEVRVTGIGFDREEHHMGIASVATVVPDARGADLAISVVVPAARFYRREEVLVARLRRAADEVRRRNVSARRKSAPT